MEHHSYPKIIFYASLTAIIIFLILWLKVANFPGINIVFIYTILITTFMLSRVIGSFFYESPNKHYNSNYEPTVSFIIPCKNEEDVIFKTITKCFQTNYPHKKIEVIAVN